MTKRVRVEVTAEDIERGRRKGPCSCPIALAARRALGCYVNVQPRTIRLAGATVCSLPMVAQDFIMRFDRRMWSWSKRRPVKPFAFTLKLPTEPHGDALGEKP